MASNFIVLSHREPYAEVQTDDGVQLRRKTNGVFATLDSVMKQQQGTWIAWRERAEGEEFDERIMVPSPEDAQAYRVRRLPLTPDEARLFYYEFTSTALWPILFSLPGRARFEMDAWRAYERVNHAFADATCEEAAPGALVWVNDFHLMLVPRLLKERRPDLKVVLFLHTTFPPADVFGVLPWREQLLEGLLHLDLIGFHIPSYAVNFANTAERFMEARPAYYRETDLIAHGPAVAVRRYPSTVKYKDREVRLGVFPVGVDVETFVEQAHDEATVQRAREIRASTGAETLILAAERLDYVKGMLERLLAFERFLERHPEAHGNVSFIQIAVPTRTGMEEFQEVRRQVEGAVGRINGQFATMDWRPVLHFYGSFDRPELTAFYLAADLIWVTPLRDGLNLVVKEFVACRGDSAAAVVLSEFAGVAAELEGPILVNPYSPDDMDRALEQGLALSDGEARQRMDLMRERVLTWDVQAWAAAFMSAAREAGHTMAVLSET
jgi:glucosylglycerol-phosphate synthase